MKPVIRKYDLKTSVQQEKDTLNYWKNKSIAHKLEIVESLRQDAIKMGLFPEFDENKPRLQRVYNITSRS
jgi:hypothetical protein